MSRSPLLLAGAAALLLLGAGPAFSQEGAPDPVVELCVGASGAAEARLDACNKLLERKLGAEERSAVLTIRGLVFLEMEADDRALSDLMAAIRQDSTNSSAYYARAIYFARIDDLKLAMADIETAIRMEPEDSTYLALRGDLRHRANDHNGALADYDRAIALDPDDDHLVIDRAMIRVDAGDYAGALADYDKAIALSDKASTQVLRADVLQALERYDEAQKGYEKVIAREPDFPMSYTGRARLHQLRGDRQAAIADLDKALALMPGDPQDYIERGWLLYETSEFTRARRFRSRHGAFERRRGDAPPARGVPDPHRTVGPGRGRHPARRRQGPDLARARDRAFQPRLGPRRLAARHRRGRPQPETGAEGPRCAQPGLLGARRGQARTGSRDRHVQPGDHPGAR